MDTWSFKPGDTMGYTTDNLMFGCVQKWEIPQNYRLNSGHKLDHWILGYLIFRQTHVVATTRTRIWLKGCFAPAKTHHQEGMYFVHRCCQNQLLVLCKWIVQYLLKQPTLATTQQANWRGHRCRRQWEDEMFKWRQSREQAPRSTIFAITLW